MNSIPFSVIKNAATRPEYFEDQSGSTHALWTDGWRSGRMLETHLDPSNDLASYKHETIKKACRNIFDSYLAPQNGRAKSWLDLGCGPGLYTSELARLGAKVTGVDFSENSLAYARKYAKDNGLVIDYLRADYLSPNLSAQTEKPFDLVTLISCDIDPLPDRSRSALLANIKTVLSDDGVFLFDFLTDKAFAGKSEYSYWKMHEEDGFHAAGEHLELGNYFRFEDRLTACNRYTIIGSNGNVETLNIWHRFYSLADVDRFLDEAGFRISAVYGSICGEAPDTDADVLAVEARLK